MKHLFLFSSLFLSITLCAQPETRLIKRPSFTGRYFEKFHVLKKDKDIRHGLYQRFSGRSQEYLCVEGHYDHGRKTGIWSFYSPGGPAFQQYDYDRRRLVYPQSMTAQLSNEEGNQVDLEIDHPPFVIGMEQTLIDYIFPRLIYPQEAARRGIAGEVTISFLVDTDGVLKDFRIEKDLSGGCGEEALRLARLLDELEWQPASKNGVFISARQQIGIKFQLIR